MVRAVSRETEEQLARYLECLRRWNPTINLMSARDVSEGWSRHIADGLVIASLLAERPGTVADLGSGAGIPGLVAAIVTGRVITLVESDRRKAAFLVEAARVSDAAVIVKSVRVEQSGLANLAVVTARALAPLTRLLALTRPLLEPGGCAYFIKGTDADKEILDAQRHFDFALTRHQLHGSIVLEVSSIEPIQCPPAS